jgi:hypothetical protein
MLLGSSSLTCMGHDDNKCSDLGSRGVMLLQNVRGTAFLSIVKTHLTRLQFLNQFQNELKQTTARVSVVTFIIQWLFEQ